MNVVIIGRGIAGIATAYCLSQDDHHVAVYEKLSKSKWGGIAYLLEPEEIEMFRKIGLYESYKTIANPIDRQLKLNKRGEVIEVNENSRASCVNREDILKIFMTNLDNNLITFGKEFVVFKFDDHRNITHACFNDATCYSGDFFVAADGINSQSRRLIVGAQKFSPIRVQEIINMIPISELENAGFCANEAIKFLADDGGFAVGVAPTKSNIIWYVQFDTQKYQILNGQSKTIEQFSRDFLKSWDERLHVLMNKTDFTQSYIVNNIYVKNINRLHYHNLVFCGEAVHKFLTLVNVGLKVFYHFERLVQSVHNSIMVLLVIRVLFFQQLGLPQVCF